MLEQTAGTIQQATASQRMPHAIWLTPCSVDTSAPHPCDTGSVSESLDRKALEAILVRNV